MGKDHPYYYLWRLLLPDALSTFDAFVEFPPDSRQRHFIRRTKEEMVHFNRRPLYPQRNCDTLSYELSQGPDGEQELYDETTEYMRYHYNWAKALNRSAARLAMSVFQRRLASSTYALLRSFERRLEKLERLIDDIRSGRLTEEQLARQQRHLGRLDDFFETRTPDEEAASEDGEQHEEFESRALEGTVAVNLAELEAERVKVAGLLDKAQKLFDAGEESKFEKLREVLGDAATTATRSSSSSPSTGTRRRSWCAVSKASATPAASPSSTAAWPTRSGNARSSCSAGPPTRAGPATSWPPTPPARGSTCSSAGSW